MEEKCLSMRLLESCMMSDWWIPRPIGKIDKNLNRNVELEKELLSLLADEQEIKRNEK
jgi:hypothetical protein